MDARTRYTKGIIKKSLFTLLQNKNITKITVKEICELSEINRATFYRYYENQYDLLDQLQDEIFSKITKTISNSISFDEMINNVTMLFYKEKEYLHLLLGDNTNPHIQKKIYNFCYQIYKPYCVNEDQKTMYRFLISGISGVLSNWIDEGMNEPPENISKCLIMCFQQIKI